MVYNPTKGDVERLRAFVAAAAARNGWASALWVETTAEDPGTSAAQAAMSAKVDLVLVAGGDGTVRAVAEQLQSTGLPLALIPSGTGNLLARNLGLNTTVEQAVETAFTGSDREIDVATAELTREDGTTTRTAFMVMAGIGFDAAMAQNTSDALKRRLGWLAYVEPIARSVIVGRRFAMQYRVDGGRLQSMRAHTVIVGNCGTVTANILLMPDAIVDDGLLDIVVFRPRRGIGWARIAGRIAIHGMLHRSQGGRAVIAATRDLRGLQHRQAAALEGRFRSPQIVQLDGDSFGPVTRISLSVRRRALTLRVPSKTGS